jgi:hypothetical protein
MQIIRIHYVANESEVLGTSSKRAVCAGPFRLSIKTYEALAVRVHLARSMRAAVVLAHTRAAMTLFVKLNLSPIFLSIRWCRCGSA